MPTAVKGRRRIRWGRAPRLSRLEKCCNTGMGLFRPQVILLLSLCTVAGGLSAVRSGRAETIISLTSCQTINASGSYRLGHGVSGNGFCFSIRASNVTFDGKRLSLQTVSPTAGSTVRGTVCLRPTTIYGGAAIKRVALLVDG